ncbi:MAG TPA: sigma-70 family RNA polymerase sigma factor [Bacteroidales bacterium]|nr:sigma-70 family RNA polymerase sigma factor [Bacteroidales bacterium]
MKKFTDKEIIEGIRNEDHNVLSFVYSEWYPMIEKMVVNMGGRDDDAKDVFQDAMLIIYRKISSEGLYLSCKFSTYIYSISHKLWLQELKSAEKQNFRYEKPEDMVCEPEPVPLDQNRLLDVVERHLSALSTDCQKILRLHFKKSDVKQIRKLMGYRTTHHAMDRKYRCKQSLINRILKDPDFIELRDELIYEDRTLF